MLTKSLELGDEASEKVVLVHGFTQVGAVWADLARALSPRFHVIAPDLPGHGMTPPDHDASDLWDAGRLLGDCGGTASYVGYSLGARVALHLALHQPSLVERLVIVGARAGLRDDDARQTRVAHDHELSQRIAERGNDRLDEFIDEWLSESFNSRLPEHAQFRDLRLQNRAAGLAASLVHTGAGAQDDLWDRLGELNMPVLVIDGEFDTPSVVAESEAIARAIGANARHVRVPGVGHAIPFEDPDVFSQLVTDFLRTTALNG